MAQDVEKLLYGHITPNLGEENSILHFLLLSKPKEIFI